MAHEQPTSSGTSNTSSSSVQWLVLRASHGGGLQTSASGLRFISVPHAVLLGTAIDVSLQGSEEACAGACLQMPSCVMYNYCPPEADTCQMDSGLVLKPPRTCYQLQRQMAVHGSHAMPLLGNGSGIATTAGAPLERGVANTSLSVAGYVGLLGFTVLGYANVRAPAGCVFYR